MSWEKKYYRRIENAHESFSDPCKENLLCANHDIGRRIMSDDFNRVEEKSSLNLKSGKSEKVPRTIRDQIAEIIFRRVLKRQPYFYSARLLKIQI